MNTNRGEGLPESPLELATHCNKQKQTLFMCRQQSNRARQLYKNISMLFLFPVKDGKLSTGVIAIFNSSCYG